MPSTTDPWARLGRRRRALVAECIHRDRNTPGYACPRCRRPIDWTLAWPDPLSPSADHIIELQDGGPIDDIDNLATTHLTCNASKGAARRWQRERQAKYAHQTIQVDPYSL